MNQQLSANPTVSPLDEQTTRLRLAPVALDEAFAELPEIGRRIDRGQSIAALRDRASRDYAAESQRLFLQIATQLRAIEQQRERLVHLLDELDTPHA